MKDNMSSSNWNDTIAKLKRQYLTSLESKLAELNKLIPVNENEILSIDQLSQLIQLVHKLAGSGKTFGFAEISNVAQQLEIALIKIKQATSFSLNSDLLNKFKQLKHHCEQAITQPDTILEKNHQEISPAAPKLLSKRIIVYGKKDETFSLVKNLKYWNYEVKQFNDVVKLIGSMHSTLPSTLIIFSDLDNDSIKEITRITEYFKSNNYNIPIIYISNKQDFDTRLQAVRLAGTAFLTQPYDNLQLMDYLSYLSSQTYSKKYHILIVDDDELLAQHYASVLSREGMEITVLNNPKEAISFLTHNTVDLVLLDFNMPECNGLELATLLRQLEKYISLPIIFLSTETHLKNLVNNAHLGIDDFLSKPVSESLLLNTILDRAERSLVLRRIMEQDSATGLLNHTSLKKLLSIEIEIAKKLEKPCSYALLDIDFFKKVNDTYGHAVGDRVIKTIAYLLRQRLRGETKLDVMGEKNLVWYSLTQQPNRLFKS